VEILLTIGKMLLVAIAVAAIAQPLYKHRKNYELIWSVGRRFRLGIIQAIALVITVLVVSITLYITVPILSYGWLSVFHERSGNFLVRPITEGSESPHTIVRLFPPLFFFGFMFALPYLAMAEEIVFRKGYEEWKPIVKQSIKFGLAHLFMGVPLAVGIALIIPGLFFGLKYKKAFDRNVQHMSISEARDEAVMVSTTHHTLYNVLAIGIMLWLSIEAIYN
jgi:hypothetical protein